jgi:hypothetical protein
MKIRIPMAVSEDGTISSSFYLSHGVQHQDVALLLEDVPAHLQSRLIHIVVDVDVELLFKNSTIEGSVDLKGAE